MADHRPRRPPADPVLGDVGHDLEPDPAALDELMRAFADDDRAHPRDDTDHDTDDGPDEHDDAVDDAVDDAAGTDDAAQGVDDADGADDADEATVAITADDVDDTLPPTQAVDVVGGDAPDERPIIRIGGDVPELDERPPAPVGGDEPAPDERPIVRIDGIDDAPEWVDDDSDDRPEPLSHELGESADLERVVIAVDDELPDAVYIQGSLDGSRKESVVFIEDDGSGDTMLPESERDLRRGIEPRMRERRLAVRRAEGRKRLKWVIAIAGVVLLVVAVLAVLGSGLFAVREDRVFVTGNVYTDEERLAEIIDDLVGTPVLLVDTQRIEREIEEIAWVDEALVRTAFPHSASIEILERRPWSTFQGPDGRFRVLDDEGRVLDVLDGHPIAYVLLTGPDPVDLDAGEFAPRGYAAASELAKNLTGSIRGQVERIDVTADGSRLAMWLDDGTEVRFGEARDLIVKLVRLETVLATEEGREPGVIDVSTREVTL